MDAITVIGGGLAGCEAAWQAARLGRRVRLYEMKPQRFSPAHTRPDLAELVCSNSLKAEGQGTASGVLKEELRLLGSFVLGHADRARVPAGASLAVDRELFSAAITRDLEEHPAIELVRQEVEAVPARGTVVIATGPLTADAFAQSLAELLGGEFLFFHDAIAPVILTDSIDPEKTYRASRYDKGEPDFINCPLSEAEYRHFISELLGAETAPLRDFETLTPFEGCMPVEVMAGRGPETLAFGPMRPVGLIDPRTGRQPHAVVQLRQENRAATLYNMVGFQTRLKWPEQKRVFRLIPGLEQAEFARYGSMHRNTYIRSPGLLGAGLQLKADPRLLFAGQITGVEGYVESIGMGLLAGINAVRQAIGQAPLCPPPTTITGALAAYITDPDTKDFQPMNANFGILPELGCRARKTERKKLYGQRALEDMRTWMEGVRNETDFGF